MTAPLFASKWHEIAAAKDAAVRALGHAALCRRATKLMPLLTPEDAAAMRAAMAGPPGNGLRELVHEANRGVPC